MPVASLSKILDPNEISSYEVEYEQNEIERVSAMLKAKDPKPDSPCLPSKVYGVDFSGAKKAGSKIWIASALIVRDVLKLEDCFQAKDLPGSAAKRDSCLRALYYFISSQKTCAFGLDFPFSLPSQLVEANDWEEFVLSFGNRYPDPEEFRGTCFTKFPYLTTALGCPWLKAN